MLSTFRYSRLWGSLFANISFQIMPITGSRWINWEAFILYSIMLSTQFDSLLRSEIKIGFVFGSIIFFAEKCITNLLNENCANWENCWQRNTAMYSAKDHTRCTVTVSWFSTLIFETFLLIWFNQCLCEWKICR